jgi:hypothetical protein
MFELLFGHGSFGLGDLSCQLRMKTGSYARELPQKEFCLAARCDKKVIVKMGKKSPTLPRGRREELTVAL